MKTEPTLIFENKSNDNHARFREELEHLINTHSMENGSDTPDFTLADYLSDCLKAFDKATNAREFWYGRKTIPSGAQPPHTPNDEVK